MLFESESQADNFIKFNSYDMEELCGKVPVRSYYCPLCMGWHVTSNPNVEYFDRHPSRASVVLDKIMSEKAKKDCKPKSEGEILESQGLFYEACLHYLTAYHSIKGDISRKDSAQTLLKSAFDAECKIVSGILDADLKNDPEACMPAKRCFKLLKRASQNNRKEFEDYLDTLSTIVGSFPKAPKKNNGEKDISDSEKEGVISETELMKKEQKKDKQFRELKMQVERIHANLIAGQRIESLMLIRKSTQELNDFVDFPKYKDQIIALIDDLMDCRRKFSDMFEPMTSVPGENTLNL